MHPTQPVQILRVDSSARTEGSITRRLTEDLIDHLNRQLGRVDVTNRDLARTPPPLINADWIAAGFTEAEARNPEQRQALALSDELVAELYAADVVVLGVPIYNFGVPAALKAWVDLVARARVTFRYTERGPEGLLKGKRAYVVLASGGVEIGSAADFASTYLRHMLGFLGIDAVEIIAAEQTALRQDAVTRAQRKLMSLIPTAA